MARIPGRTATNKLGDSRPISRAIIHGVRIHGVRDFFDIAVNDALPVGDDSPPGHSPWIAEGQVLGFGRLVA